MQDHGLTRRERRVLDDIRLGLEQEAPDLARSLTRVDHEPFSKAVVLAVWLFAVLCTAMLVTVGVALS